MFEIEIIEIATKSNQTSRIEQNTSNFQDFRKNELDKKKKQKILESSFEIANETNKNNVSSYFVIMLRKRKKLNEI